MSNDVASWMKRRDDFTVTGLAVGEKVTGALVVGARVAIWIDEAGAYGCGGWVAATVRELRGARVRLLTDARWPNSSGDVKGGPVTLDVEPARLRRLA